jgi:hypothetical protein
MARRDEALRREWARQWVARRRAFWFRDKTCCECGSREQLELLRIDPTVPATHLVWSWSTERREAELTKFRVICHDCKQPHVNEHLRTTLVHGTAQGYDRWGCRCDACGDANRIRRGRKPLTKEVV